MLLRPNLGWAAACLWRSRGSWRRRRWWGRGAGGWQQVFLTLSKVSRKWSSAPIVPSYHINSLFNRGRSVGRRGGGTRENRQRQKGGEKVEKVEKGEKVEKVGFSFPLLDIFSLSFEGEEGVGRVKKPDCEQGVHWEEILQEVTWGPVDLRRRQLEYVWTELINTTASHPFKEINWMKVVELCVRWWWNSGGRV